jgi:nitrogen fixation protein NifU and related proteins
VVDGTINDSKVGGQGCSISQSSASMMSQAVKGKSLDEVRALVHRFKSMMSIEELDDSDESSAAAKVKLGDLEALQGVVKFPVRIKCAVLAWNTLTQALSEATA